MKNFITFLTESIIDNPNKHLEHAEDEFINNGHTGFKNGIEALNSVHSKLTGKNSPVHITVKYDGSPAVVFGKHQGKFFVATKSAFNVKPKLNFSHEDIDKNHPKAGLRDKLHKAFDHLQKIAPDEGMYQGDLMFTHDLKHKTDSGISFKPNTIKYTVNKGHQDYEKVDRAKLGIAVHTQYGNTNRTSHIDFSKFKSHPDVHLIQAQIHHQNTDYPESDQHEYNYHVKQAGELYQKHGRNIAQALNQHGSDLKTYINKTVRTDEVPTFDNFLKHVKGKHEKRLATLKSRTGLDTGKLALTKQTQSIKQHEEPLKHALKIHNHLQNAKNKLVNALSARPSFVHTINDKPAKPEGFVASHKGAQIKLVDRKEFSKANFLQNKKT